MRILAGALLMAIAAAATAAPKAELWARWAQHSEASTATIDHGAWAAFLTRYLDAGVEPARLAYGRVSAADRDALERYLEAMQLIPITQYNPREQMAYWINLYNAQTVALILAHYPVESITKIKSGWFSFGPWDKKVLTVEGHNMTLNDIEHRVLRPVFEDPRIHYAVNCASLGCPSLAAEPYRAETLDAQLDAAARRYVNAERGVDLRDGRLVVSSIYAWFKADFGGTDAGVIAHLRKYAEPELKARLKGVTEIADDRYDWSLNDAR